MSDKNGNASRQPLLRIRSDVEMRWTIPSKEEAEEYTQAYLAAQEAYFEELMENEINIEKEEQNDTN